MAKGKSTRKLSAAQIVFYTLCVIIILSMVLTMFVK
jgi:hypothetical protein